MKSTHDFKKDWEKTRIQLIKFSKEAAKVAKKGEEELIKFSKRGKLHLDSTAANLKKEQLFYQIGKEYISLKDRLTPSSKLKKLVDELNKVNREQSRIKSSLKASMKIKKNASA